MAGYPSMALNRPYPVTDNDPPPIVDLSSEEVRERLSPSSAKAFLTLMDKWKVSDEDARQLLTMTSSAYSEMKKRFAQKKADIRPLDQDRLTRISYLFGIFKALQILHKPELADRWVQLPNINRIFAGRTPLDYMIRGGMPAMETVRRLLDARRGGI